MNVQSFLIGVLNIVAFVLTNAAITDDGKEGGGGTVTFPTKHLTSISMVSTGYDCNSTTGRLQDINNIATEISGETHIVMGSPAYQAYDWLLNTDITVGCDNGMVSLRQRYILAVFYYMTNGDTWIRNDGWLKSDNPECTWFGVACDLNGLVTSLLLGTLLWLDCFRFRRLSDYFHCLHIPTRR
jgi:hypothetical protein